MHSDVLQALHRAHDANAQGRHHDAVSWCSQALQLAPNLPEAWYNLALAYRGLGSRDEALVALSKAGALSRDNADAQNSIGLQFIELDALPEAENCLSRALALSPQFAFAYSNLGILRRKQRDLDEAETCFRKAIGLQPGLIPAYANLCSILNSQRRFESAEASARTGLTLEPASSRLWWCLSAALSGQAKCEQALSAARKAVELDKAFPEAWISLGVALAAFLRIDEALLSFGKALAIDANEAAASWNTALLTLLKGEYKTGWALYESRWRCAGMAPARNFSTPFWLGDEDISGKTLLIYPEQGLGDYVQFCRYALLARDLGAKVVLEVPAALLSLVSSLPGEFTFVADAADLPFDLQCPVMSLPLAFGTELSTIFSPGPYLSPPAEKRSQWHARLGEKKALRIGLVWAGSPGHKSDARRSIPLAKFRPILEAPVEFHALQKEITDEDLRLLSQFPQVKLHSDELTDFSDTAALISHMDLVISVDTSVAHVAGAMGAPVWVLLPFEPDFRWLLDREDSPWYPTAKLYRQPKIGDWDTVISRVVSDMRSSMAKSAG